MVVNPTHPLPIGNEPTLIRPREDQVIAFEGTSEKEKDPRNGDDFNGPEGVHKKI